jgi:hypothetical protein
MLGWRPSTWLRMAFLATVAALALTLSSGALAASGCKKINGKLTLQPLPTPCASAINVCATGTYQGDLKGTSSFTGTSFTPTVDSPATGVFLLTGDNTITTSGGTLITKDAIVLRNGGSGDFAEVDTIIGGTGEWSGATGFINATGIFDFASGGTGDYTGQVCTP